MLTRICKSRRVAQDVRIDAPGLRTGSHVVHEFDAQLEVLVEGLRGLCFDELARCEEDEAIIPPLALFADAAPTTSVALPAGVLSAVPVGPNLESLVARLIV